MTSDFGDVQAMGSVDSALMTIYLKQEIGGAWPQAM